MHSLYVTVTVTSSSHGTRSITARLDIDVYELWLTVKEPGVGTVGAVGALIGQAWYSKANKLTLAATPHSHSNINLLRMLTFRCRAAMATVVAATGGFNFSGAVLQPVACAANSKGVVAVNLTSILQDKRDGPCKVEVTAAPKSPPSGIELQTVSVTVRRLCDPVFPLSRPRFLFLCDPVFPLFRPRFLFLFHVSFFFLWRTLGSQVCS